MCSFLSCRGVAATMLALLCWPAASSAQESARSDELRRWDDARVVARASQHSPEVLRARSALYEAHALAMFSRVPRVGNPTIGVRAMVGLPDPAAATYALLVGMPIDVSGARGHFGTEARWAIREADARVDVAMEEACASAREAWADTGAADAALAIATARRRTAEDLLTATRTRLAAQAATALDVALAERESAAAESAVVAATRAREEAAARLREQLGLAPTATVAVTPINAPAMPVGLSRERAAQLALSRRRELVAHAAAAQRLRTSSTRLHHEATAPLFIAGEVEWQGYSQASVGLSAQWSLPVALTNQGERATAEAQARGEDDLRSITERVIGQRAVAAWTALELRLSELAVLDQRSIPTAERVLALTETLYRSGTVDVYRLLRARDDLFAEQSRRVELLREAWRARIALDRSIGRSEP
jgi:outer membrane protein TolC